MPSNSFNVRRIIRKGVKRLYYKIIKLEKPVNTFINNVYKIIKLKEFINIFINNIYKIIELEKSVDIFINNV